MQIAIVGLAGSGKTTVFNTLTRGHAETGGFGGMELHVGVVKVPDERLEKLAAIFKPKKIVQADVTYVDLPAPPASSEGHVGTEDLPAEHLARLRDSDALLHVVRAFDDPNNPHPEGSIDPARDIDRLDTEFILADLALVEREPDEAAVFMEELGIAASGLDRVIELSYRLLGLISFLTAGPDEVRAWPIRDGSNAVDAAGAIHSDLAKGFIRAETVAYEDLVTLGSMAEARKAGRLRSEGKTYRVRDGDVVEILFSR